MDHSRKMLEESLFRESWEDTSIEIDQLLSEEPLNLTLRVNVMFILLEWLLYAKYKSEEQRIGIEAKLINVFNRSLEDFRNCAECHFFFGFFSAISFWFFGLVDERDSHRILRRACELEPENSLYQWGFLFSTVSPLAGEARLAVLDNPELLGRLKSYGQPGAYILNTLEKGS